MDCSTGVTPSLHLRCCLDSDPDPGRGLDRPHPRGHFPQYRHSRDRCGLAVHRIVAGRDVQSRRFQLRTVADHHCQRHRTHRIAIAGRRGHRENLFPPERADRERRSAGDGDQPEHGTAAPAGYHAAVHHYLQRLVGSHPPARPFGSAIERAATGRHGTELHPHAARYRERRGHSISLRREAADRHGRPQHGRHAVQRRLASRRRQHHQPAKPDSSRGHGQDGIVRIPGRHERFTANRRGDERPAGQNRRQLDDLRSRRRIRARWFRAADQHCPRRWRSLGADVHPEVGRRFHARCH